MHPVDGALVGAGSLWPIYPALAHQFQVRKERARVN